MAEFRLPMTDEQFSAVASKAMYELLDEKAREKVVTDALATAMRPSGSGYGSTSAVQQAFDNAIRTHVQAMVKEHVDGNPAIKERVRAIVADSIERLISADYDWSAAMGVALAEALKRRN